jgi:WD40 repeat protein
MRPIVLMLLSVTLTTQTAAPPVARVDLYGDPLPPGAIARLGSVRFQHPSSIYEAAFSSDGKLLAASNDGGRETIPVIIVWERSTGRKRCEIILQSEGYSAPKGVRFSSDNKRISAWFWERKQRVFQVWDAETGKPVDGRAAVGTVSGILGYANNGASVFSS